ncbi:MAG TPA: shikimate kinase [Acidimicrobiia bacterium]|nr:shikimate kinase [Acidimicrobiia bacterium]
MPGHIVVVGPMGSGKSTLAGGLARSLERQVFDSDKSIEERTGRIGREIARTDGVEALHRLEADVLLEALSSPRPAVVAAAASVIEDPEVREALEDAFCVWVTADSDILAERSARGSHRRAVARHEDLGHRDLLFEAAADLVVDTGELSEAESLRRVLEAIEASRR